MNRWSINAILYFGVAAICLLALSLVSYRWVSDRYSNALGQLEPRIERLKGLIESNSKVEVASVAAQSIFSKWGYPFSESVQNDVQRSVRQMIESSGMSIVANQAAYEVSPDHQIGVVHLNTTVTGEWAAALKMLELLQAQTPPVIARSIVLMRENGAATAEPQLVRVNLQLDAPVLAKEMP